MEQALKIKQKQTMNLPPFKHFPLLEGEDIILRAVGLSDLKDLMEISYYDGLPARTLEDAVEMQRKIDRDQEEGSSIHWCIAQKTSGEILGTVGYYRGFPDGAGELGCVMREQFRGKGIMTKALDMAANYGLNTMGLQKVRAITTLQNTPAIRLLERAHFKKTATLENDALEYTRVLHTGQ